MNSNFYYSVWTYVEHPQVTFAMLRLLFCENCRRRMWTLTGQVTYVTFRTNIIHSFIFYNCLIQMRAWGKGGMGTHLISYSVAHISFSGIFCVSNVLQRIDLWLVVFCLCLIPQVRQAAWNVTNPASAPHQTYKLSKDSSSKLLCPSSNQKSSWCDFINRFSNIQL